MAPGPCTYPGTRGRRTSDGPGAAAAASQVVAMGVDGTKCTVSQAKTPCSPSRSGCAGPPPHPDDKQLPNIFTTKKKYV